jgi:lactoylglutathione lyase
MVAEQQLRPFHTVANPIERTAFASAEDDMKLNHLNLTVSSVPETHQFLEKYFGLKVFGAMAPSEAMGFLSDDNGLVLALFRGKNGQVSYPAGFHIGFIQESEERVNQINQRLQDDGFKVPKPARLHGSWTFYFQSPGGFTIEVLC